MKREKSVVRSVRFIWNAVAAERRSESLHAAFQFSKLKSGEPLGKDKYFEWREHRPTNIITRKEKF